MSHADPVYSIHHRLCTTNSAWGWRYTMWREKTLVCHWNHFNTYRFICILMISFIPETPFISVILTSGRLVTVKLKLAVSADANKYAFGAGATFRRSHRVIGLSSQSQSEQRLVADSFLVFAEQAASDKWGLASYFFANIHCELNWFSVLAKMKRMSWTIPKWVVWQAIKSEPALDIWELSRLPTEINAYFRNIPERK